MVNLRLMRRAMVIVIFFTFCSCTSFEEFVSKIAEPDWVSVNTNLLAEGLIDFTIYDGIIWESGDTALELRQQIFQSLNVILDDEKVSSDEVLMFEQFDVPVENYDEENEVIGTHYDASHFYVFNLNLTEGFHTLEVKVTSASGRIFSHSWNFEVTKKGS